MAQRATRRAAAAVAILALTLLAVAVDAALQRSLERRAREFDIAHLIRQSGLEGRVDEPRWEASRLNWLPRPRLRMLGVETSIHSGLPGPGRASGRLRLEEVRLVPGWKFLWRGGLDRIEIRGGFMEIGRDLLPEPPRTYQDPLEGRPRLVPWAALLSVAANPAAPAGSAARGDDGPESETSTSPGAPRAALVSARDLDLRFLGYELIPGRTLALEQARLQILTARADLQGALRVTDQQGASISLPFRLTRRFHGGMTQWEARLGPEGSGLRARFAPGPAESAPNWSVELEDPAGQVAAALLEGRSGPLRRLRWSGPWRLQAHGGGPFPGGLRETNVELLSGGFSLDGAPEPFATVRGRVSLLPGRADLPELTIRSRHDERDSARVQFHWLRTAQGKRINGEIHGRLNPAWIALAGEEWRASGQVHCDLSFEGRIDGEARSWSLVPRGTCTGSLERLSGPWFVDTLRQGRVEIWTERKGLGFVLAGAWGGSPFRLETRGLPHPGPRYLEQMAAGARWELSSSQCRVEDFRLTPERFPRAGPAPFWLGLPGRGTIRIEEGTFGDRPFHGLRASVFRSRGVSRVDSLEVSVAGGRIENATARDLPGPFGARSARESRFIARDLDLATLQAFVRAAGVGLPGEAQGRLSGRFRLRWGPGGGRDDLTGDGSVRIASGSLRGLPAQEALRRRTGLDALSELRFDDLQMEMRRVPGSLSWTRLRVDAPPLRIEGAGRVSGADWVEAAMTLRVAGDGPAGDLARALQALLGEDRSVLYATFEGAAGEPQVALVSRGAFLRELERLGGALPSDPPVE